MTPVQSLLLLGRLLCPRGTVFLQSPSHLHLRTRLPSRCPASLHTLTSGHSPDPPRTRTPKSAGRRRVLVPNKSVVDKILTFSTKAEADHRTMSATELPSRTQPVVRATEDLEKPAIDKRLYRVIRLPNKLEALLIHDPDTDRASCALDVGVGSFSDAEDLPGIAHAVEHLLFMGTEKVFNF